MSIGERETLGGNPYLPILPHSGEALRKQRSLRSLFIIELKTVGTGWCVSVSQPPAEVCLTDLNE